MHSDQKSVILDIDREHFNRHVRAIRKELDGMLRLYLPPRVRGGIVDLKGDLAQIVAWDEDDR